MRVSVSISFTITMYFSSSSCYSYSLPYTPALILRLDIEGTEVGVEGRSLPAIRATVKDTWAPPYSTG